MAKRNMYKQYQAVQLKCKSLKEMFDDEPVELKKGQRGIILDVLLIPNVQVGYAVEFFDETGETVAVTHIAEKDLAPVNTEHKKTKV
jgi:hypothetical protein